MSDMGQIYEDADAAMYRLKLVDAFLCMIHQAVPALGSKQMDESGASDSVMLEYVRDACAGIRMMLTDVTTDVEAIRHAADKATGKGSVS